MAPQFPMIRLAAALCLAGPVAAMAQDPVVYSLSQDWSDTVNPFGQWTLKKSPTALFTINQYWSGDQLAWVDRPAPQTGHVPAWGRYTGPPTNDLVPGDVFTHTPEFDHTGTDVTSVVWTAPAAGSATVVGEVWCPTRHFRQMRWELRASGAVVSGGDLISNGTTTRANPFFLQSGTGGGAAMNHALEAGDQLELAMISVSQGGYLGDLAGVRFEVHFSPTPVDADADGLLDEDEIAIYFTDPADPDTDDDGLLDGTEVEMALGGGCPSPLTFDSDGDGLGDGAEVTAGTNPCSADSDGDGLPDAIDPLPTDPSGTSGFVESALRALCDVIHATDLAEFDAPNPNAAKGRRNALCNRVMAAANAVAAEDYADATDQLTSLLAQLDGDPTPPDWMAPGTARDGIRAEILAVLALLPYL